MSAQSLHITNGDSVLYTWKKCGLLGTHIAWRDALNEGPVPEGLALEEMSNVRADYLSARGYGNAIKLHHEFEKRDAVVRQAADFDEIVLWFEHDLYDQLQMLQILHVLREMGMGAGRVQLVLSDQFLGWLSPDELMALYPKRRFVTAAIENGAARAWAAFTSRDPRALLAELGDKYVGLPFLHDALRRLTEEYPAADNGLSRTQKQVLEAIANGARRKEEIFSRAQAREEASFHGDTMLYAVIDDLCAQPAPLIVQTEAGYETTVLGRRILGGDTDWLEHQPLDRWIGGAHLTQENDWRWDEQQETLVRRRSTVQG